MDAVSLEAGSSLQVHRQRRTHTHAVEVGGVIIQLAATVEDERGVIVRHLVLPGHTRDSKQVLSYLHETFGERIAISILNQYTPCIPPDSPEGKAYPELLRRVTAREYDKVVDYALELGINRAFIQEGDTAKESFIPPFKET
mgnify:CR=1 FL=1